MATGQIIRKVMSDGWTIEEHYDEKRGHRNRYYYGKKRAPAVSMTDKISQQYAAYSLIEKDLRNVLAWLDEIDNLDPKPLDRVRDPTKMNLVKGLFVAALTFYAKCFTSCEGRKLKLDKKFIDPEHHNVHEAVMSLRHNFAAHSGAENFEDVRVSLVLHPNKRSNVKPQLYSEFVQPDNATEKDLAFRTLVRSLQAKVTAKRSSVGEIVLSRVVLPKGKSYWYKQAKS